jgi:hypothetical protein
MHSLQTRIINMPMVPFSSPCGTLFNGPCDTSIALNTMQACTDVGHTRAPVETATEGPGNCGNILSGSTIILATFYEHMLLQSQGPQINEVLSSSQA